MQIYNTCTSSALDENIYIYIERERERMLGTPDCPCQIDSGTNFANVVDTLVFESSVRLFMFCITLAFSYPPTYITKLHNSTMSSTPSKFICKPLNAYTRLPADNRHLVLF